MNWTTTSPLYQNQANVERLEGLVSKISAFDAKRTEEWMNQCFAKHAPGIVVLVKSGQIRAASIHATQLGFKILLHENGGRSFVQNEKELDYLKPIELTRFKVEQSK